MSWSWFSAELARVNSKELGYRVNGDSWYLALHDFIRSDGETTINGGSRSTLTDIRDKLTFLPAGSSAEGWNRFRSRTSTVFAVHFVPPLWTTMPPTCQRFLPLCTLESNNLKTTLLKLQGVLDGSGLNDSAYVETLGLLLLWELRHIKDLAQPQTSSRGTLTPTQLKRIRDFVGADLSRDITVSDLAAVAGLSQFHFIRAFKQGVGLSPYQYVLSERVCRARELLTMHSLSISEVAAATGFSDTVQLSRAFRRFVALTPIAFRRSLT